MLSVCGVIIHMISKSRFAAPVHVGKQKYTLAAQATPGSLVKMIKSFIPPLTHHQHKGQSGRLAVVGGCEEYTGAPYFAAISALKVGSDLCHVFCTSDAAYVIKSYSPELIVHPTLKLDKANAVNVATQETSSWLERMHGVVLGPGLGRNPTTLLYAENVIEKARSMCLPIIIDADGLFLITQKPDLIKGYKRAILTPNVIEFSRLYEKMFGKKPMEDEPVVNVKSLSEIMGNITIVLKGASDVISDGKQVLICYGEGSPRRCGGQGDLLSGSMGVFSYWAHQAVEKGNDNDSFELYGPTICAAYAACLLTRHCNYMAFKQNRRSMTTSDMIGKINEAFRFLFE